MSLGAVVETAVVLGSFAGSTLFFEALRTADGRVGRCFSDRRAVRVVAAATTLLLLRLDSRGHFETLALTPETGHCKPSKKQRAALSKYSNFFPDVAVVLPIGLPGASAAVATRATANSRTIEAVIARFIVRPFPGSVFLIAPSKLLSSVGKYAAVGESLQVAGKEEGEMGREELP